MLKKRVAICAIGAVLCTTSIGRVANADETIRIGLLLPLKGVYASLSDTFYNGWKIALEEFGNKIANKKIVVILADTEAKPNVAMQKATRLIKSDGVSLLTGIVSGGVAVAMGKYAGRNKFPLIVGYAIPDSVTGKNCNPYVARTSMAAYAYTSAMGAYWAKKHPTASTIAPDYAAGHALIGGFVSGYKKAGGKIINQYWSAFKKTKDFGPIFAKIKRDKATMLYGFYAGGEAIQVVKQYAQFGMRSVNGPIIGGQWIYDQALWPATGSANVGGIFGATAHPQIQNDANRAFVAAYTKAFGKAPDVNAFFGYENAKATLLTIKALKGDVSNGAKIIRTMRGIEFDAPRGRLRFNKDNNAQIEKIYVFKIVKNARGKIVPKLIDTMPGGKDLPGCKMAAK